MYWKAYSATNDQWWVSLDNRQWIEAHSEPESITLQAGIMRAFDDVERGKSWAPVAITTPELPLDRKITRVQADMTIGHATEASTGRMVQIELTGDGMELLSKSTLIIRDTAKLLDVDALELAETLDLPAIIVTARAVLHRLMGPGAKDIGPRDHQLLHELNRALNSVPESHAALQQCAEEEGG